MDRNQAYRKVEAAGRQPQGYEHVLILVLGMTDTPAFRALLAAKGLPIPTGIASAEAVAEVGLAQLRRARILAIDASSKPVFGE